MEWLVALIIFVVIGAIFGKPSSCSICGQSIKKTYYKWTISGKSKLFALNAIHRWSGKLAKRRLTVALVNVPPPVNGPMLSISTGGPAGLTVTTFTI
ncbi:hypothetical protein [Aeromonas hydrophila]|uniref:hypothetical protein n=1 Tax=Aeromonas hydrophila TaxID=644 RepID=UPI00398877ED